MDDGRIASPGTEGESSVAPFASSLERHGLQLLRDRTTTFQVNVGLLCNQACRHCHLDARPGRREVMGRETMDAVIDYARRTPFSCIDITGGAPEMVPELDSLLEGLASLAPRIMLRSNLTAISEPDKRHLVDVCRELKIAIVASFPSTNENQADSQRGKGVWEKSVSVLKELNAAGYGRPGTGLDLDLVVNPAGSYLPADQCQLEKKYRLDLQRRWDITFSRLYTFANMPLGRFGEWLRRSGTYEAYLERLADRFNPATLPGLMCRNLLSVSWDGTLYDCDFNQAAGLPFGGRRIHITGQPHRPPPGTPIAVGDHCYACTAGSGFT